MKLKNFRTLIARHLTQQEMADIEKRVRAEVKILKCMQENSKKTFDGDEQKPFDFKTWK